MVIRAASMFSGIGGAELALPEAQWLWCAEIEPFPCALLAERFGHPNLGDITAPDFIDRAAAPGQLDLLCGGPPCQAFSIAGLRKGMLDPRGLLSLRFIQVAHELADRVGLRNALVENVPGWLSHPENAFGCFLGGLVGADDALPNPAGGSWPRAGMVAGPRARAAWRVLDAQYAGLAQRRERVFLVADLGGGADPVSVLFERQGLLGNPPPRREAGEGLTHDLAPCLTSGGRGVERGGETRGQDPVVAVPIQHHPLCSIHTGIQGNRCDYDCARDFPQAFGGGNRSGPIEVAATLTAKGQRVDFEVETFLAGPAHTLRAEGFDASEDGSGRGTPLVPELAGAICKDSFTGGAGGRPEGAAAGHFVPEPIAFDCKGTEVQYNSDGLNPTLRSMGHKDSHRNGGGHAAVAFDLRGREGGAQFEGPHDTANIRAASGGSSKSYVCETWVVRRLTPTECERLQGYPDNWTLIEHGSTRKLEEDEAAYLIAKGAHVWRDNKGALRTKAAADGPRYKALGNAWAVACVRPVALRLHQELAA